MPRTTHIIGAGLAGLSAAVELTARGHSVLVHEATTVAGGRCRSYYDNSVGMTIDNGNHLLLSGNRAALAYARHAEKLAPDALIAIPPTEAGTLEDFRQYYRALARSTTPLIYSDHRWSERYNAGSIFSSRPGARVSELRLCEGGIPAGDLADEGAIGRAPGCEERFQRCGRPRNDVRNAARF